jgi:hypothetical protein
VHNDIRAQVSDGWKIWKASNPIIRFMK